MAHFYVVSVSNGTPKIEADRDNLNGAIVNWHGTCQAFWNEPTVYDGSVAILDEQLRQVDKYHELIHHDRPEE